MTSWNRDGGSVNGSGYAWGSWPRGGERGRGPGGFTLAWLCTGRLLLPQGGDFFPHWHKDAARACRSHEETCSRSPCQVTAELDFNQDCLEVSYGMPFGFCFSKTVPWYKYHGVVRAEGCEKEPQNRGSLFIQGWKSKNKCPLGQNNIESAQGGGTMVEGKGAGGGCALGEGWATCQE